MKVDSIVLTERNGSDSRILVSGGIEILFDGDLALKYPALRTVKLLDVFPLFLPNMEFVM